MKKLRNKKTGAIGDLLGTYNAVPFIGIAIDYHDGNPGKYEYNSIAELNEEWEDYKPAEPLIEDEKARKVFQEWVKLYDAERFRATHLFDSTVLRSADLTTEPSIDLPGHIGKDSEIYTITELCGEEEE